MKIQLQSRGAMEATERLRQNDRSAAISSQKESQTMTAAATLKSANRNRRRQLYK